MLHCQPVVPCSILGLIRKQKKKNPVLQTPTLLPIYPCMWGIYNESFTFNLVAILVLCPEDLNQGHVTSPCKNGYGCSLLHLVVPQAINYESDFFLPSPYNLAVICEIYKICNIITCMATTSIYTTVWFPKREK